MGKIKSVSAYKKTREGSHEKPYIQSVVLNARARYGVLRILSIGRGAQTLCHDLRRAGYIVAVSYTHLAIYVKLDDLIERLASNADPDRKTALYAEYRTVVNPCLLYTSRCV